LVELAELVELVEFQVAKVWQHFVLFSIVSTGSQMKRGMDLLFEREEFFLLT
jgi:hypothetical protein